VNFDDSKKLRARLRKEEIQMLTRVLLICNRQINESCSVIVTFFLFWFFPLGVWLVQPKVNRLYREAESSQIVC
jgi:hypothetical protein